MSDTAQATGAAEAAVEVLTDDELATVVGGGAPVSVTGLQNRVYDKIGMCRCGGLH